MKELSTSELLKVQRKFADMKVAEERIQLAVVSQSEEAKQRAVKEYILCKNNFDRYVKLTLRRHGINNGSEWAVLIDGPQAGSIRKRPKSLT